MTAIAHAETPPSSAMPPGASAGRKAAGGKKQRAVDPDKKESAGRHLRAGTAAFDAGDYPLAITELRASYDDDPQPSLLYALGQAYRSNGDCTQALEAYRSYLETKPSQRQTDATNDNIARCQSAAVAAPTPTPSAPPAAGESPETAPPPAEKAPSTVSLTATTDEPAHKTWYEDVPGDVLLGTGIAAAAVGTVLFVSGRSKTSSADDAHGDAAFGANRGDADSGLSEQRIGLVVLGAGGAFIVGGIVRYLTMDTGKPSDSASLQFAPTLGGMMARGAF
jgi:tetratricopeptide (TPR) repeat protein